MMRGKLSRQRNFVAQAAHRSNLAALFRPAAESTDADKWITNGPPDVAPTLPYCTVETPSDAHLHTAGLAACNAPTVNRYSKANGTTGQGRLSGRGRAAAA